MSSVRGSSPLTEFSDDDDDGARSDTSSGLSSVVYMSDDDDVDMIQTTEEPSATVITNPATSSSSPSLIDAPSSIHSTLPSSSTAVQLPSTRRSSRGSSSTTPDTMVIDDEGGGGGEGTDVLSQSTSWNACFVALNEKIMAPLTLDPKKSFTKLHKNFMEGLQLTHDQCGQLTYKRVQAKFKSVKDIEKDGLLSSLQNSARIKGWSDYSVPDLDIEVLRAFFILGDPRYPPWVDSSPSSSSSTALSTPIDAPGIVKSIENEFNYFHTTLSTYMSFIESYDKVISEPGLSDLSPPELETLFVGRGLPKGSAKKWNDYRKKDKNQLVRSLNAVAKQKKISGFVVDSSLTVPLLVQQLVLGLPPRNINVMNNHPLVNAMPTTSLEYDFDKAKAYSTRLHHHLLKNPELTRPILILLIHYVETALDEMNAVESRNDLDDVTLAAIRKKMLGLLLDAVEVELLIPFPMAKALLTSTGPRRVAANYDLLFCPKLQHYALSGDTATGGSMICFMEAVARAHELLKKDPPVLFFMEHRWFCSGLAGNPTLSKEAAKTKKCTCETCEEVEAVPVEEVEAVSVEEEEDEEEDEDQQQQHQGSSSSSSSSSSIDAEMHLDEPATASSTQAPISSSSTFEKLISRLNKLDVEKDLQHFSGLKSLLEKPLGGGTSSSSIYDSLDCHDLFTLLSLRISNISLIFSRVSSKGAPPRISIEKLIKARIPLNYGDQAAQPLTTSMHHPSAFLQKLFGRGFSSLVFGQHGDSCFSYPKTPSMQSFAYDELLDLDSYKRYVVSVCFAMGLFNSLPGDDDVKSVAFSLLKYYKHYYLLLPQSSYEELKTLYDCPEVSAVVQASFSSTSIKNALQKALYNRKHARLMATQAQKYAASLPHGPSSLNKRMKRVVEDAYMYEFVKVVVDGKELSQSGILELYYTLSLQNQVTHGALDALKKRLDKAVKRLSEGSGGLLEMASTHYSLLHTPKPPVLMRAVLVVMDPSRVEAAEEKLKNLNGANFADKQITLDGIYELNCSVYQTDSDTLDLEDVFSDIQVMNSRLAAPTLMKRNVVEAAGMISLFKDGFAAAKVFSGFSDQKRMLLVKFNKDMLSSLLNTVKTGRSAWNKIKKEHPSASVHQLMHWQSTSSIPSPPYLMSTDDIQHLATKLKNLESALAVAPYDKKEEIVLKINDLLILAEESIIHSCFNLKDGVDCVITDSSNGHNLRLLAFRARHHSHLRQSDVNELTKDSIVGLDNDVVYKVALESLASVQRFQRSYSRKFKKTLNSGLTDKDIHHQNRDIESLVSSSSYQRSSRKEDPVLLHVPDSIYILVDLQLGTATTNVQDDMMETDSSSSSSVAPTPPYVKVSGLSSTIQFIGNQKYGIDNIQNLYSSLSNESENLSRVWQISWEEGEERYSARPMQRSGLSGKRIDNDKKPKTFYSPNSYEPLLYQPESLDQDQIKQWNLYRAKLEASGEVHQTISPHSQNNCGMEALKFQVFDPNTREQAPGLLLNLTSHLGAVKYASKSLIKSAMSMSVAIEAAVMHRNGLKDDEVAGFSCKPHLNDTDEQDGFVLSDTDGHAISPSNTSSSSSTASAFLDSAVSTFESMAGYPLDMSSPFTHADLLERLVRSKSNLTRLVNDVLLPVLEKGIEAKKGSFVENLCYTLFPRMSVSSSAWVLLYVCASVLDDNQRKSFICFDDKKRKDGHIFKSGYASSLNKDQLLSKKFRLFVLDDEEADHKARFIEKLTLLTNDKNLKSTRASVVKLLLHVFPCLEEYSKVLKEKILMSPSSGAQKNKSAVFVSSTKPKCSGVYYQVSRNNAIETVDYADQIASTVLSAASQTENVVSESCSSVQLKKMIIKPKDVLTGQEAVVTRKRKRKGKENASDYKGDEDDDKGDEEVEYAVEWTCSFDVGSMSLSQPSNPNAMVVDEVAVGSSSSSHHTHLDKMNLTSLQQHLLLSLGPSMSKDASPIRAWEVEADGFSSPRLLVSFLDLFSGMQNMSRLDQSNSDIKEKKGEEEEEEEGEKEGEENDESAINEDVIVIEGSSSATTTSSKPTIIDFIHSSIIAIFRQFSYLQFEYVSVKSTKVKPPRNVSSDPSLLFLKSLSKHYHEIFQQNQTDLCRKLVPQDLVIPCGSGTYRSVVDQAATELLNEYEVKKKRLGAFSAMAFSSTKFDTTSIPVPKENVSVILMESRGSLTQNKALFWPRDPQDPSFPTFQSIPVNNTDLSLYLEKGSHKLNVFGFALHSIDMVILAPGLVLDTCGNVELDPDSLPPDRRLSPLDNVRFPHETSTFKRDPYNIMRTLGITKCISMVNISMDKKQRHKLSVTVQTRQSFVTPPPPPPPPPLVSEPLSPDPQIPLNSQQQEFDQSAPVSHGSTSIEALPPEPDEAASFEQPSDAVASTSPHPKIHRPRCCSGKTKCHIHGDTHNNGWKMVSKIPKYKSAATTAATTATTATATTATAAATATVAQGSEMEDVMHVEDSSPDQHFGHIRWDQIEDAVIAEQQSRQEFPRQRRMLVWDPNLSSQAFLDAGTGDIIYIGREFKRQSIYFHKKMDDIQSRIDLDANIEVNGTFSFEQDVIKRWAEYDKAYALGDEKEITKAEAALKSARDAYNKFHGVFSSAKRVLSDQRTQVEQLNLEHSKALLKITNAKRDLSNRRTFILEHSDALLQLATARIDAASELDAATALLHAATARLDAAQLDAASELDAATALLHDAAVQLDAAASELDASKLNTATALLYDATTQLSADAAQLDAAKQAAAKLYFKLEEAKSVFEASKSRLRSVHPKTPELESLRHKLEKLKARNLKEIVDFVTSEPTVLIASEFNKDNELLSAKSKLSKMNKRVLQDISFATIRNKIAEVQSLCGGTTVLSDEGYSSQRCSICFYFTRIGVSDTFQCSNPDCHACMGRDENAVRNSFYDAHLRTDLYAIIPDLAPSSGSKSKYTRSSLAVVTAEVAFDSEAEMPIS